MIQTEKAYNNPPESQSANPTPPVKFTADFLERRMLAHRAIRQALEYEDACAIVREVEAAIYLRLVAAQEEAETLEVVQ